MKPLVQQLLASNYLPTCSIFITLTLNLYRFLHSKKKRSSSLPCPVEIILDFLLACLSLNWAGEEERGSKPGWGFHPSACLICFRSLLSLFLISASLSLIDFLLLHCSASFTFPIYELFKGHDITAIQFKVRSDKYITCVKFVNWTRSLSFQFQFNQFRVNFYLCHVLHSCTCNKLY